MFLQLTQRSVLGIALFAAFVSAHAQEVTRKPIPSSHPLIGAWKLDVPGTNCHEVYRVREDGTTAVTSGEQVAESVFELDLFPSAKGFFKWVDKITKDNGKPDCMGSVMQVGHVATNYILLHPDGNMFLMCEAEELSTCIGPLIRMQSDA